MRLTTSAASILLERNACGAGADTEAEGRVAFPDVVPDPADQRVGHREVTSAVLTFLLLTGWVTADASAVPVSGAPGVLATTPDWGDRVVRWDDPHGEMTWLIGDPADLSVDPLVDGGESDVPDTAAVAEVAAPDDDAPDDDARDDP